MSAAKQTVTIFGAGGFIGRQILRTLSKRQDAQSLTVRVASRFAAAHTPASWKALAPSVGTIQAISCDINNPDQVSAALNGATDVVNCVGILFETPRNNITFERIQHHAPQVIATAVKESNTVRNVVHISAIGADLNSNSAYARTKALGEKAVLDVASSSDKIATVLRPSIVFGREDSFFNRFERMSRFLPFLPLVGGGTTKYQPVHVKDVAAAVAKTLAIAPDAQHPFGVYELGGKVVFTFKELLQLLLDVTGRKRVLLPIPFPVASIQGAGFEAVHSLLPSIAPLLTRDQVELLKADNVVSSSAKTLYDLEIEPKACSAAAISYIR